MNQYIVYMQDTGESYGPFQILCRDYYRFLDKMDWEKAKEIFGLYQTVAILDPNASVILANMVIDKLDRDHLGIVMSITPKSNIFPEFTIRRPIL